MVLVLEESEDDEEGSSRLLPVNLASLAPTPRRRLLDALYSLASFVASSAPAAQPNEATLARLP